MSGKHASRFAVRAACLLHEFDFELQVSITMLKTAAVGREVGGESHIVGVSSGVLHRPAVRVALFRICCGTDKTPLELLRVCGKTKELEFYDDGQSKRRG